MTDSRAWPDGPVPDEPALPPELDPRRPGRRAAPAAGARTATGRSVPRQVGRALSWVAVAMSVTILAVTAVGLVKYRQFDANITRGGSVAAAGVARPSVDKVAKNARNVLLIGSDSRDNEGNDQFQGTGADRVTGLRSDTVILAHLYGDSDAAQLVSFPRDSWVTIPAWTDPKTGKRTAAHQDKINSAITEGGPGLLVSTVEQLTDVRIDDWVIIDFNGFQSMVNQLGGVEVCLNKAAKDSFSGINLPAGKQVISGAQALAFVRQRHGLPNGDIDRIARQQHFIAALTRKVLSAGTLLNPGKLNGFLDTATNNLTVDNGLSGKELYELAIRMRGFSAGGVAFTTVPFTDIGGRRNGQSVVLLDDAKMATLFAALKADKAPSGLAGPGPTVTPTPAPTTGLIVPPTAIRVSVLNGAGVQGLASRAANELKAKGYTVVGTPGNRGSGASTTVIRYGPTRADSARTLAASLPGSTLEQASSLGSTLEVVVGSDYVSPVTVTIDANPTTTATPPTTGPTDPLETAATAGCVN